MSADPVVIPHFAWPYTFSSTTGTAVVEQDSIEEIAACATVIADCPQGAWADLPAFGRPPLLFQQAPPSTVALTQAIVRWEPRAAVVATEYPDVLSDAIRHVIVNVSPVQANQ